MSVLLLTVLLLCTGWVWPWQSQAGVTPKPTQHLTQLENLLCAPQSADCVDLWRSAWAEGAPFSSLAAVACLPARYKDELAGINCLEAVIGAAPAMLVSTLSGRTEPGELQDHKTFGSIALEQRLAELVAVYSAGVPAYCDQATPVIYDYFDCLLIQLQAFERVLRIVISPVDAKALLAGE